MQRVLITGAAGQLGQSFQRFASLAADSKIDFVFANRNDFDLTQTHKIKEYLAAHDIHVVVNLAAYTAVDLAESEPLLAEAINATAVEKLGAACCDAGVWLVHVSTDYVFDGESEDAYSEISATNPINVYGHTKLAGEQALIKCCPNALILRTSWVFSEYGNNFLKTMLRLASSRDELGVVADQMGTPTYAPHIAEAILKLVIHHTNGQAVSGIYHFSGDKAVSWCDFARAIFSEAAKQNPQFKVPHVNGITTAEYPTPAKRPRNSVLSVEKLERLLGALNRNWQDGVRQAVSVLQKP